MSVTLILKSWQEDNHRSQWQTDSLSVARICGHQALSHKISSDFPPIYFFLVPTWSQLFRLIRFFVNMFKQRQSSLKPIIELPPGLPKQNISNINYNMRMNLGQAFLVWVASRSPCQPRRGSASWNLILEIGGVAYGTPVKLQKYSPKRFKMQMLFISLTLRNLKRIPPKTFCMDPRKFNTGSEQSEGSQIQNPCMFHISEANSFKRCLLICFVYHVWFGNG